MKGMVFKLGRNNDRALDGPVELPNNGAELIDRVSDVNKGVFRLWSEVYVQKLIY